MLSKLKVSEHLIANNLTVYLLLCLRINIIVELRQGIVLDHGINFTLSYYIIQFYSLTIMSLTLCFICMKCKYMFIK